MNRWIIDHPHNEASALLGIQNPGFLERRGWETGFWIVSDERKVPKALAALGRTRSGAWEVVPVHSSKGNRWTSKVCEDCETLSRAGSRVYVFGSQYGTKEGPLEPKRHFVARFNEALLDFEDPDRPEVELELVRRPFALHRLVNDAFREMKVDVLRPGEDLDEAFVRSTAREGRKRKKAWNALVRKDDLPVNVEGSTFLEGGRLLLGLRYPVTRDGHPLIVELEGIDRFFEPDAAPPRVLAVHILDAAGDEHRPAGIRELDSRGGWVHAVTGGLDDELLGPRSKSRHPASEHWVFRHPYGASGLATVAGSRVRTFGRRARVEGIALDRDHVWYVHDGRKIRIERSALTLPDSPGPPGK